MKQRRRLKAAALALGLTAVGCSSPASVAPLMRVANRAMEQERALLEEDRTRVAQTMRERRAALERALQSDAAQAEQLDAAWALEAAYGYGAALEALARHEVELSRRIDRRQDNLAAALQAQRQALTLLETQDQLVSDVLQKQALAERWPGLFTDTDE